MILGRRIAMGVMLSMVIFISAMGSRGGVGDASPKAGEGVMDLETLFAYCALPAVCVDHPRWQDDEVIVSGYLDPANIFWRHRTPRLPYDKFTMVDHKGRAVEVWPQGDHNDALFENLLARTSDRIVVSGRLAPVKIYLGEGCTQGIKILVDDESQVRLGDNDQVD